MMAVLPPPKWRGTFDRNGNLEICVDLTNPLFMTIVHDESTYESSVGSATERIDQVLHATTGGGEDLRLFVTPSKRSKPES